MKNVFISYNSQEFDDAVWVKSTLETNGISCWMAPMCIPGGSSYAVEIPRAIRACKIFVLILSEKSQNSKWVAREVDLAINEGKVVLPFMLENCSLKDDFNFYLTNVQRYAAYENKIMAIERMVNQIKSLIAASARVEAAAKEQSTSSGENKSGNAGNNNGSNAGSNSYNNNLGYNSGYNNGYNSGYNSGNNSGVSKNGYTYGNGSASFNNTYNFGNINTNVSNNGNVGFGQAIKLFFKNYANFSGRASRSEFWYATLFCFIVMILAAVLLASLSTIVLLGLLIPSLSSLVRRWRDTGKSWLWIFVPYAAFVICCLPSKY